MTNIYPLTIIKDRYNGCYSGGKFFAFNQEHGGIPDFVGSDDGSERNGWDELRTTNANNICFAVGNTIEEAVENLRTRMIEEGRDFL